ncbi:NAD(P)H-binding protein [soil metagenome]
MKLTIFGATGRTGRHLLEQALADGHEVTAFVRDPAKLPVQDERLHVVQGDIRDAQRVEEAVRGADAVLSALSSGKEVLTQAAQHIIPAMRAHGVRRLISLVGAGVPDAQDPSSAGRSFMRGLMKLVARDVLQDAERHAELVRESGLDWTLVRPPRLDDGPRERTYRTGILKLGPAESISRADVADFMLKLAGDHQYVRQAPMVSY